LTIKTDTGSRLERTALVFLATVCGVTASLLVSETALAAPTPTPGCIDAWVGTSTINAPTEREYHTAVWTGSEMIVWGGGNGSTSNDFDTGGRYSPGTDNWITTSTTNAPTSRSNHTAVWTGSEMIIWGGFAFSTSYVRTGGRYSPGTDTWTTATTTTNAPAARAYHTAIWTGSEMIVWGGWNGSAYFNTGGRYDPSTNSWTAMSATNAPSGRTGHTAIWTGSEMIVWGGYSPGSYWNTGGRYNPSTDTWTALSITNAPFARDSHTAVWTGSEMIVWGGYGGSDLNTGGRYNPGTDSWTATSTTNVPNSRSYHTTVWTGGKMIVWGGQDSSGFLTTGGIYTPGTDSWTATSTTNVPIGRDFHSAVWTGNEMIVWGGYVKGFTNTGGRYCGQLSATPTPSPTPSPTPTATATPTPNAIFNHPVARLAADPVRPRVYATVPSENTVIVIDTTSLTITSTIPIGSSPQGLAVSVDGSKLWVANSFSTTAAIGVIDLNTLLVLPSLPAPAPPYDIKEGSGHRLYVTSISESPIIQIMQIDGETGAFQRWFGGFVFPSGLLEITPDRNTLFYATTTVSPSILEKFNVATEIPAFVQQNNNLGSYGEGLRVSHSGQFIVFPNGGGNAGGYSTFEIPTANITGTNGSFDVGAYPLSATFSNDDTLLYHGTAYQSAIKIFDTATFALVGTIPLGQSPGNTGGFDTRDVIIDRSGRWIFIATDFYPSMGDLRVYDTGRNDPIPSSQLANISTRMRVLTDENVLIGGFIVTGTDPKPVLLRGIGPSLTGVTGALADPTIELHQGGTTIAMNDNWKLRPDGGSQQAEIEATGIPPANDLESALVATLNPGAYTAILRGKDNATGVGLVEAYDLGRTANSKLANISTRGFVDTGDNVMIGGLIVVPPNGTNGKIAVRAIGPSLSNSGIQGALQDPTLDLVNSYGVIVRSNNNWRDSQQAEIIAAGLQPSDDRESALIQVVTPGNYTAIVRGSGGTTGVALVEVYHLQ
jgi:YVTN family beta-propeller protein